MKRNHWIVLATVAIACLVVVACGPASTPVPTATATPVPPTETATQTPTPVPPTETPSPVPPTETSVPPTSTATYTPTPVPPTDTPTPIPPTDTPIPPTSTPTPKPKATAKPKPKATATPTEVPPPQPFLCCPLPQPGQGLLWFDNHVGEEVEADVGPGNYRLPAKQGDVAGCLCLALDAGHYSVILKTATHKGSFEIDIVSGGILRFPVGYQDH